MVIAECLALREQNLPVGEGERDEGYKIVFNCSPLLMVSSPAVIELCLLLKLAAFPAGELCFKVNYNGLKTVLPNP